MTLLTEPAEEEESRHGTTQQRMLREAAGCSHSTEAESEGCPSNLDAGVRDGTSRPRIPPSSDTGKVAEAVVSEGLSPETTAGAGFAY